MAEDTTPTKPADVTMMPPPVARNVTENMTVDLKESPEKGSVNKQQAKKSSLHELQKGKPSPPGLIKMLPHKPCFL